ncbi:MAG: hypothetical protein NWF00_10935 [Candidatus Bathyarchaeota archaeon]|nr:hypothetical protein [Candidatus Bathyarchaeota archaeon]
MTTPEEKKKRKNIYVRNAAEFSKFTKKCNAEGKSFSEGVCDLISTEMKAYNGKSESLSKAEYEQLENREIKLSKEIARLEKALFADEEIEKAIFAKAEELGAYHKIVTKHWDEYACNKKPTPEIFNNLYNYVPDPEADVFSESDWSRLIRAYEKQLEKHSVMQKLKEVRKNVTVDFLSKTEYSEDQETDDSEDTEADVD